MVNRHICYLADAASIHTIRWVNYFAEHGWKVNLITWHPLTATNLEIHPDVTLHRILFPPHYIARYGALIEITRLLRKIHPNIIHAHFLGHFGILAGLYSSLTGFHPIVISVWGRHNLIVARGMWRYLMKHALKKADVVHCDAEHMIGLLTKLGAAPQKIKLINFGIDTRKFSPEQRSERFREESGVLNSPTLISLRRADSRGGVEYLIQAIPLVMKEVPEAKFIIGGQDSTKTDLKELAKSLGVSQSIKFVGLIPNEELPQYLASSDVYVSTSLSDAGLAASTAEAMACGLPAVITDFGDNRKWVEDGVNGFIVPLKDPKTLAEKIIYLLGNEAIRVEFGERNRKIIEQRNSYYKEMEKMDNIYKDLIGRYKS